MMQMGAQRFGRLALDRVLPERSADNHIVGLWHCDCGVEKSIPMSRVRNGYSKSCGCAGAEASSAAMRKHGMHGSPEYSSWHSMKWRCLDPNNKDFPRWGGRGITVCQQWADSFEAFYKHIGPRPAGTSLDRIDNTRGYEPGNVRWATYSVQQSNRRDSWYVEIDGTTYGSLRAAAEQFSVSETTIVRWCDGYTDTRRSASYVAPRKNSRRWKKYDDRNH